MSQVTRTAHKGGTELSEIRDRLASRTGRTFWRSLDEVADTEAFRTYLHREFPEGASELADGVDRRAFLKVMGASFAFAGLAACTRQPVERLVPYVRQPEQYVPGKPLFYASATTLGGYANGILVESHMGRPTKIEGNPDHPASLGATDVTSQAEILSLYDPDRSQVVREAGRISTWSHFVGEMTKELARQKVTGGQGFRILTETVTSPTITRQIRSILKAYPNARWHQYEAVTRDAVREGSRLAFGKVVEPRYRFENARRILSLDADFLSRGPSRLANVKGFSKGRRPVDGEMNRLYVVESTPTITGGAADHRLSMQASRIDAFARHLAGLVGVPAAGERDRGHAPWAKAAADDLNAHRGRSLVIAGEEQPAAVHALAHAMNEVLGNVGKTVTYGACPEGEPVNQAESLASLTASMAAGEVDLLLVLGGNPVASAPGDIAFLDAFEKVRVRVHAGLYEDETSRLCHWHVPMAHDLETWGDARAFDGTVTVLQPLIKPLYAGRSIPEILALAAGDPAADGHDVVRNGWKEALQRADFDDVWQKTLHDGVMAGTELPLLQVRVDPRLKLPPAARSEGVEVNTRPDPTVHDGRYANNGWLQELPKPLTKLTWDNAALVSPAFAEALGVANEDVVAVSVGGRRVEAPVWVLPGQPEETVTLHLGYGRTRAGRVGTGAGVDVNPIRTAGLSFAGGAQVEKTGARRALACTQDHHSMEGRELIRSGNLAEYLEHPEFAHRHHDDPGDALSMIASSDHVYDGRKWGMSIDLNACIGCNACTIACQSENNIPVVGKTEVARGREMHWIRIDRYFEGDLDAPDMYYQPVPCQQCENAPCEVVCPVAATVHSDEGLNDMVYNRCVGTRYCSNNCPYKVRRFNFFHYSDDETESYKPMRNPDVTIRSRGVMEKCTYCVQRISAGRIEAKKKDRSVADGEVVTACQQVCPADAIVFGDMNDPDSAIARAKADARSYGILTELNTQPRTTYLARLRNPNPVLETATHG